jgi:dihydroflavonol-4-reductase
MKALVTGATGFVGSHVARALLSEGFEVTALVREGADTANLDGLELRRAKGELSDEASLRAALRGQDALFHVAALYAFWSRDPRAFREINVEGTERILRLAAEAGVSRIVHTSTVGAIAGCRPGEVADERSLFNLWETGDPYIRSKHLAEEAARTAAAHGVPVVIVNPSTPVGPGDYKPTPTGASIVMFVNGSMPGYSDGGLNLVDVRDVARGHVMALQKGRVGERYILGGVNLSIKEMMALLARVTGLEAPRLRIPVAAAFAGGALLEAASLVTRRPPLLTRANARAMRHLLHYRCDRAISELGYSISPLEPAIRDAVVYFDARGMLRPRRMAQVWAHFEQGAGSRGE